MRRHLRNLLWAGMAVASLSGAYTLLSPASGPGIARPAMRHQYRLVVPASGPIIAPPVLKALEGDTVMLSISSGRLGAVHVHGYDRTIPLHIGGQSSLEFTADRAGYFELHFHDPDGLMYGLAALEVQPR